VFCMEYLTKHMSWLKEELGEYEDDYLIVDCPGQIELYTHIPIMKVITDNLQQWGYRVAIVYLIDAQFMNEPTKFLSGTWPLPLVLFITSFLTIHEGSLMCLSAMVQFELPHINVLTKLDLLGNKAESEELEKCVPGQMCLPSSNLNCHRFFEVDCREILSDTQLGATSKYRQLTDAIAKVVRPPICS